MIVTRPGLRPVVGGIALALLLAGMIGLAPSASASFTSPFFISPTGYDSLDPRVSFDRRGDAAFVWMRESHEYPHPTLIQMRRRGSTGTWGATVDVSPGGNAGDPKIALDDDGDAIVVWRSYDGTSSRVYARRVARAGTLGTVKVLSTAGLNATGADVAVDSAGNGIVTWAETDDNGTHPKMRRYLTSGQLPAAVQLASKPGFSEPPVAAFDRDGDAVLAWTNDNVVQARTLSASGTLSGLKTVSGAVSPIDRHFRAFVTVDRDGDALVTWKHWTSADQTEQIWGRWLSRSGTVGRLRQLTPSSHTAISDYSVAGDLAGDMVLTWYRFPSNYLYARTISSTATIGSYVRLSTVGTVPTVRLDDDGDGVVVYQGLGAGSSVGSIRVRKVSRSGTFGPAQVIADPGAWPVAAISPTGRVIVGWTRASQVDKRVQVSVGP